MIDEKSRLSARTVLTDYMRSNKMRCTPERFAILDKVCVMTKHFGIDSLYESIEADGYHVSRATIYNTMELLLKAGLVRRHNIDSHKAQYERVWVGNDSHLHLICSKCGKIKEVNDMALASAIKGRSYSAFHPSSFNLYVYGVCSTCVRRSRRAPGKGRPKTQR